MNGKTAKLLRDRAELLSEELNISEKRAYKLLKKGYKHIRGNK